MSARKPPLLLRGGLTGRVYVVTAYTDHGDGRITAREKYDVTDQYKALVSTCSCGKPFPEDGGAEGVCECCSGCGGDESQPEPSTASVMAEKRSETSAQERSDD